MINITSTDQNANNTPILEVKDLKIKFNMYGTGTKQNIVEVVSSIDLDIPKGNIVAVVGSSGSGKSLLAHTILDILPPNAYYEGTIKYMGNTLTPKIQSKLRGKEIVLIPQSVDFLDPLMKVGKQVVGINGNKNTQREFFEKYDLDPNVAKMYPYQLSGGMARRILIATAISLNPSLIIADEPTAGLSTDLAIKALDDFRSMADHGTSILLITHDIDIALSVADYITVFYAGTTIEIAPASDFKNKISSLRHPYTKALIDALPQNSFNFIDGAQPYVHDNSICTFIDRCPIKSSECNNKISMTNIRGGKVRCINAT